MSNEEKNRIFLELLDPLRDQLYMYSLALEKNLSDAEDLVSESILTCYEYFESIRDHSSFKAYLFKIARTKYRRKKQKSFLFIPWNEEKAENIKSSEIRPDLPLDIEILYKALDKLPQKKKEAVVLFEISGFSIEEIKDLQGGTISGVKSRLKRGRENLALILGVKEKEDKKNGNPVANKFTNNNLMLNRQVTL